MLSTLALVGCATTYPMMPTPVLYTGARARPLFTSTPDEVRSPPLDLLFFTDRALAKGGDEPDLYVGGRRMSPTSSRSMALR